MIDDIKPVNTIKQNKEPMSVRLKPGYAEAISQLALKRSVQRKRRVTQAEVIEEALDKDPDFKPVPTK